MTPTLVLNTQSKAFWERIAVDLMGLLNETEMYNRYILVVQDYFSKWVEAYPIRNEQATMVAEKIVAERVCRYGDPHTIHSDQGTNFELAVFQKVCELLGIEKTHTTPFHPQSDGQVEQFNGILQKILSSTVSLGLGCNDTMCSDGIPCDEAQFYWTRSKHDAFRSQTDGTHQLGWSTPR